MSPETHAHCVFVNCVDNLTYAWMDKPYSSSLFVCIENQYLKRTLFGKHNNVSYFRC